MGERAAFALVSPSLEEMGFKKGEDDNYTTALGYTVGVIDGSDVKTGQAGPVRLVGSPMLVKYGNAGGENLDQETVVVRAFVVMGKRVMYTGFHGKSCTLNTSCPWMFMG